jgi:hypothetical protein
MHVAARFGMVVPDGTEMHGGAADDDAGQMLGGRLGFGGILVVEARSGTYLGPSKQPAQ